MFIAYINIHKLIRLICIGCLYTTPNTNIRASSSPVDQIRLRNDVELRGSTKNLSSGCHSEVVRNATEDVFSEMIQHLQHFCYDISSQRL